ncbi:MAG: nucleoside-diphosphate kinase [Nitrososphaeraceae archaeon]
MSNLEQTLIVVKPDGLKKGLVGKIISRFEEKGFQIVNLRSFQFDTDTARKFYDAHKDKHFFNELVSFICSGKTVGCILEGNNAISTIRLMVGNNKSTEAQPGTIRGDFGLGFTDNIIHASDSAESFIKESKIIFS